MRGIAILGIVAHNYWHMIGGIVKENEFQWSSANVQAFLASLSNFGESLPFDVVSFFGHYGVPVFLFLSGYGLEMKYGHGDLSLERWRLSGRHYVKLFKMMLPGLLVSMAMACWCIGLAHNYSLLETFAMFMLVSNFFPDPAAVIFPGPYWFFGLMLQLYAIYFLVLCRRSLSWTMTLVAVCVLLQLLILPESSYMKWYRYNFMGSMLPFGVGIAFARGWLGRGSDRSTLLLLVGLASYCLLAFACLWSLTWTIAPLFACYAVLCLAKLCARMRFTGTVLEWVGSISAALFVWHPIVRSVLIVQDVNKYIGFLLFVVFSGVLALMMSRKIVGRS